MQAYKLTDGITVLKIVTDGKTYTPEQYQAALAAGKAEAARTGSRLVYADLTVFKDD
jgi:hypothetical protein